MRGRRVDAGCGCRRLAGAVARAVPPADGSQCRVRALRRVGRAAHRSVAPSRAWTLRRRRRSDGRARTGPGSRGRDRRRRCRRGTARRTVTDVARARRALRAGAPGRRGVVGRIARADDRGNVRSGRDARHRVSRRRGAGLAASARGRSPRGAAGRRVAHRVAGRGVARSERARGVCAQPARSVSCARLRREPRVDAVGSLGRAPDGVRYLRRDAVARVASGRRARSRGARSALSAPGRARCRRGDHRSR